MSTTDRTNLLTWLPEAAECVQGGDEADGYWCEHPATGPARTAIERELSTLTGYGITPVAAYAKFLERLTTWQEETLAHQDSVERDEINPRGTTFEPRSAGHWGQP